MKIIRLDLNNIKPFLNKTILCLGYFDGVHLAHRHIIKDACKEGYDVGVLSFNFPPKFIAKKSLEPVFLTSIKDKANIFESLGVKYFLILNFDENMLKMSKESFVNDFLKKLLPYKIFCGTDYRFGLNREGDPYYLSSFFEVKTFEIEQRHHEKISSTSIINNIKVGDISLANELLGRRYRIEGEVVEGNKIGRTLGFPTANLMIKEHYVIPKVGVYVGYAYVKGQRYKAMIQVGTHPTIKQLDTLLVEVHILNFDEDIYHQILEVEFIKRIRDEQTFSSINGLVNQLHKDKELLVNLDFNIDDMSNNY